MKNLRFTLLTVLTLFIYSSGLAQPYTLDEKIVPNKLELKDDKKREGAKYAAANVTIADTPQYFYVNGCNMFQFIDVFIFSNFGSPDFKAELVKNTWGDVEKSESTGGSKNGIINFKLRTEGDFGFKVIPTGQKINYTIIVYASGPIEEYLGSAFKKASESDLKAGGDSSDSDGSGDSNSGGSSNTLLYILLGVALLVIGFLASKVLSKNKAGIVLLFISSSLSFTAFSQEEVIVLDDGVEEVDLEDIRDARYEEWVRDEMGDLFEDAGDNIDDGLDRLGRVGEIIEDDERYRRIRDLYDSYTGLGDCISSVPPPGMPRVPSFCDTDDCGTCFVSARQTFNQNRYSFERLKTIYDCTKTFTDAAIAFGDNASGVHGVSGLAWQSERKKIMKSIKDLQKAYDDKYVELLDKQRRALTELNNCEAQHGIPDWYDRFGYMYYEFTAMHYKRSR